MKLKAEQLSQHLSKTLLPIYIFSGDEPLIIQECSQQVHEAATQRGFVDKKIYQVETGFDWQALFESANSLSLFSTQQRIDLRIPMGKPGDKGHKALLEYSKNPNPDTLLLITFPKLEASALKSKWFKALENGGAHIQVWPLESHQFLPWLKQRAAKLQLTLSPDAFEFLASQVDGNLLAASQELEKLRLLDQEKTIDLAMIENSVGNSARYDAFQLSDSCLQGDLKRSITILQNLKLEGAEPTLILWSLSKDIRALYELLTAQHQSVPLNNAFKKQGIWPKRQKLFHQALSSHSIKSCQQLLNQAFKVDKSIKGVSTQGPWLELSLLVSIFSSPNYPLPHLASL